MSKLDGKGMLKLVWEKWQQILQAGKDLGVDTKTTVVPTDKQTTQEDFRPDR